MAIDWVVVKGWGGKEIGAIGFIGNRAAIVASFYDSADANQDNKVSITEWIVSKISPVNLDNYAITQVAMTARFDLEILQRDASFGQMAMNLYINFAKGLVADGIYTVYFSRGVSTIAKPIARRLVTGMVKEFVVRKGMEAAVKTLAHELTHTGQQ